MSKRRIYIKRHRSGSSTTWLKLEPGEIALIVKDGRHYKLGSQHEDIVHSDVIAEAREVCWCSVSQQWADAASGSIKA